MITTRGWATTPTTIKDMKTLTKEQVIELVSSADGLLIATNAGERHVNGWDECIEFAETLKDMNFDGFVPADKAPADITESPEYEPEWGVYKFSTPNCTDSDIYINIGE